MKNIGTQYPGPKRSTGFKSLPEAASRTTKPILAFTGILKRGGIRTAGNVIGSAVRTSSVFSRRDPGAVSTAPPVSQTTKPIYSLPAIPQVASATDKARKAVLAPVARLCFPGWTLSPEHNRLWVHPGRMQGV